MNGLVQIALSQYGVTEVKGERHNPIILNWFKQIGHQWVDDDETAWCSCFMNWVALRAGYEMSGKLNARSWLKLGEEVLEPKMGDVVVFWREKPDSWKGHVGIYINQDDNYIYCLGGNQNNQVRISAYPVERFLAYRRLRKT